MARILPLLASIILVLAFDRPASATSFTFYGIDANGVGSATMTIDIVGTQLTLTLNNTSPTTLLSGTGLNAPGITGFGFNTSNTTTLTSWSLTGQSYNGTSLSTTTIGGSSSPSSSQWLMGTQLNSVQLNYLPNTGSTAPGSTISGALYNPATVTSLLGGSGNNTAYYTTATLVMNFSVAPILSIGGFSPYVRMQNVGANGAGSLKLTAQPPVIPEPTTLVLVGTGLLAGAVRLRRNRLRVR